MAGRTPRNRRGTNDHHTMFTARFHEVYQPHQDIRENPSMIAHGMAIPAHDELHNNCSAVPPISYYSALRVANQLPVGLFVLDGIDQFCSLVEASNKHPKAKRCEIALGELAIETLREQIPYIKEGLIIPRKVV